MSNFDSDSPSENEWDDRGELAWNEFDWEQYLREQDEMIHRYIGFYEQLEGRADRLDQVAHRMGWDEDSWSTDNDYEPPTMGLADLTGETSGNPSEGEAEPYTLHKNPVFIATKGIFLTLIRAWERTADRQDKVDQPLALALHSVMHRAEQQAMFAISALDFGDYAMAISLLKRAMRELNACFSLLNRTEAPSRALADYNQFATSRLFDLREIWLRIMNECREELERPTDEDDD
ncbi:hypothetical protein [Synoicihabitans lomoniglobus]|uniref:Vta1 C-terminal domain-containing protein n=1 Tax=Synoicihabitans lomoniglobus TaxID=2909285 RepID=A0AAF0CSC1_9BACT|nr:hypothetical protein [Opitutaceae bacterium LMO-M01]WED67194.1 hypothetical protein PXH66_10050 [Opitutaceae bacterium LMO-M01]